MPRDSHSRQHRNRSRSRSRSRRHQGSHERERSRGRGYGRNDSQRKTNDEIERRRRRQSSSSSSTSSSNSSSSGNSAAAASSNSAKLLKTLENRRLNEINARKRAKNELKAKETPEEKRARRLMEKQAKEQRRRQRMGWDNEYQHYSNEDNPFGDSNLTSTFRWGKKLEKEGLLNVPTKAVEVLSLQKALENKRELEKVKKRRMERELERQARDDEMLLQQRNKEAVQFREWQRQEDQFHLEQARLRSEIRIRDGRAKPIDLLAQYVSSAKLEDAIEMQMHEPYALLNGLEIDDLEDLLVDIKVYVELEKDKNIEFWNDMVIIVEDELQKQRRRQKESAGDIMNRRDGIHQSVVKDVADIFRGKNATQLDEMRTRIETKINQRAEGVDISYWESLLSQLKAHMARARLRDRHQEILREKLLILKKERDENTIVESTMVANTTEATNSQTTQEVESESTEVIETKVENPSSPQNSERSASPFIDLLQMAQDLYNSSGYSPVYVQAKDLDDGIEVLSGDEDDRLTHEQRVRTLKRKQEQDICNLTPQERKMFAEARKSMQGDEAEFSVETPVEAPAQMATDKYRPRKPRYFNRVHTGFEWNKYNQTHYDMDNPPPKIVQGYKFNIFYPDLMDKSLTPQYFLIPCEDNPDFAVLRFHTGPPYEDIAFKIVNREWEFSYKRGFRCQFQNNIFQLWFHFKRYRYRR